jgi:RimJ/RimL family protein N-acetyltransferase
VACQPTRSGFDLSKTATAGRSRSSATAANRSASWDLDRTLVALAVGEVVGVMFVIESSFGFGEIGMMVAANWRGRGVGTALVAAAIEWARARGLHKLTLSVFPHNEAAIALYEKFRFVEEGRLTQHVRRANGELWDLIEMGLLL